MFRKQPNPVQGNILTISPFSLCVIHKEGLCPSSGDIDRLIMMMIMNINNSITCQEAIGLSPVTLAISLLEILKSCVHLRANLRI
jgi:hypothetical protein